MGDTEPLPHSGNSVGPEVPSKLVGPVVAPGKKDKDPWKDVAKKVADGKILFKPLAAINAANECKTAIGGILGIQKTIAEMIRTGGLKELSQLPSGGLLAAQFNNTLCGLNDVLSTHKQGLNTMLDTFKTAANKFIDAELDSEAGFDKKTAQQYRDRLASIKASSKAGKTSAKPKDDKLPDTENMSDGDDPVQILNRDYLQPTPDQKDLIDEGRVGEIKPSDLVKPAALPNSVTDHAGKFQSQPRELSKSSLETGPNPENPDHQEWHDLYLLGKSTGRAKKDVHHVGEMWKSMATDLDKTVGTFATNLMNTHGWSGDSHDAAIKAVKYYHAKATGLAGRMKAVSAILTYTSEWLANTEKGMPTNEWEPKPTSTWKVVPSDIAISTLTLDSDEVFRAKVDRHLAIYRQNMENNYVQGVQTSSDFVPALDELPVRTPKIPGTGEKPPGKQDTGDGPTGKGGGTGPGLGGGGTGPGLSGGGLGPVPTATANYRSPDLSQITPPVDDRTISAKPYTPDYTATTPASADPTDLTKSPTSMLDGLSQAANLAQPGLDGASSAMQAAARAAQDAAASGLTATRAGAPAFPGGLGASSTGGGGASKIGGGAGLSGSAASALQKEADAARMFPRANAAGPASPRGRPSGIPGAGVPGNGTPGSPGAGAGQGQGQNKDYKRPKYLESSKHLDKALGDAVAAAKAVVGEVTVEK